ncbi:LodA/GoxA family CTQ-dependent oxidase [Breoghania sp. L-A4]|uniref:LodA/GoxA family CTQ-dependent oxidase n=1 Tax=Breoghania sp. L-A4 TaxID=2304600 RepID=UPI000E35FEEE|nr:LodA/GoxA family CTQ-dependent oxidase [Breoghania sp. L-A4]AXS40973.1 hypothetical protein D1F64_14235 [Breoghania sp. L-A4]
MASTPRYRIHPGIGIARVGDSPDSFYLSPETPGALPVDCDASGNPRLSADGESEVPIRTFKDGEGRIRRQAARFQIYVYDEQSSEGRVLRRGDPVEGGGNRGVLVDMQWRVHLANKKAAWFAFDQLEGEHGYSASHPLRNPDVTGSQARQQLIIDPGPQVVNGTDRRRAAFSRDGNPMYAATFPPKGLVPHDVDTLGEILTDDAGRLVVLGGHGRSGSCNSGLGQPRIDTYANNDGWFDDISDGPVMARLVMYSEEVGRLRFIDVDYPAWALVGYPRYAPQVLDMVTLDDVVADLAIREQADRTDLYGTAGTFDDPEKVDTADEGALLHWKAGRLRYNPDYWPWFWRDIWPILFRPDEFTYFTNVLQQSNFPHNQQPRGNFDPLKLCVPPRTAPRLLRAKRLEAIERNGSGALVAQALEPAVMMLDDSERRTGDGIDAAIAQLAAAASNFAETVCPRVDGESPEDYASRWREIAGTNKSAPSNDYAAAEAELRDAADTAAARLSDVESDGYEEADARLLQLVAARRPGQGEAEPPRNIDPDTPVSATVDRIIGDFVDGVLLDRALKAASKRATTDPYGPNRRYLYDLLRLPGEENTLQMTGSPTARTYHLPLMPLLAGDNPLSNVVPSKFLRLTDTQLFLLRQWAEGRFYNEVQEGWVDAKAIDPWQPYKSWVAGDGRALDRGVLSNLLGGAFCPGGEVCWIIRNPAIWHEPYRLKADPAFYTFRQTAAQANAGSGSTTTSAEDYVSYAAQPLAQDSDYGLGLQPGDLTKQSGLPWQADFNECSTQQINVTYDEWNSIDPTNPNDPLMAREARVWETLWWPAHRPMQAWEIVSMTGGSPGYQFLNWARGVPQTNTGDYKMVTEWSRLGFIIRNPYASAPSLDQPSPDQKYISVERAED